MAFKNVGTYNLDKAERVCRSRKRRCIYNGRCRNCLRTGVPHG